ncbi:MAG: hypothetical protein ACLFPA_09285 [Dichotomicrobium sp.]
MLAAVPWLVVVLILYNIAVFVFGGTGVEGARALLQGEIVTIPLMSGARWSLSVGDAMILLTLVLLFVELMKAARRRGISLADQALSTIILIICMIQFLMVEKAATSVFLVIAVAAFIDVIAGFVIALRAPRRSEAHGSRSAAPRPSATHEASPWPSDAATQGSQLGQGSHG